ncbi:uncharacterized protein LOC27208670 isoform X2 [Drosophila simulans]|uniref:Uncharacterized protein, isoform B n=1 Tax=Drosophila simulans TaxID=7240 RepID=A0A0J9TLX0_DROSI|nr:uncharacterized protein LOC27208670 isoform X2 [Drosophila simulans]KMY89890.1 uncharacterized protein Dsimw501_GD28826, isoform B [Drosophila simulans]
MSKKSQDEHTKDKDSEEEDEEELQAAIREIVKIPDIDIIPRRSTQSGKQKESTGNVLKKNHAECGSQTGDGKDTTSKTGQKKLESDDSWAALLRKRFAWTKDNQTDAVPSKVNQNIPNTKGSSKDFLEKKKSANKLSTDFSNESLIRSEKYENYEATKSLLNNQLSEESPEFLDKLRRIEEASKPKTWKRPTPVVLKPNPNSSATKKSENELEAKPQTATNTEETHGCINILKVPFHRNLYYVPEKPSRQDMGSGTSDFQPGAPETPIVENNAVETDKKADEIMPENVENSDEKKTGNSDSPKTVTITGHSHITAKWDAHCHFREKETGVDKAARRVLIIACILCSIFLILEVVGGIWANSLAIATDAAHLLTDLASFLISISALHLAARPSSERLNFGWHRAEVIGAMVSIFFIWVVTGERRPRVHGHNAMG